MSTLLPKSASLRNLAAVALEHGVAIQGAEARLYRAEARGFLDRAEAHGITAAEAHCRLIPPRTSTRPAPAWRPGQSST